MRWRFIIGFVALFVGQAGATAEGPLPLLKDNSPWHSDYESARLTARQSGKPLFVVFR